MILTIDIGNSNIVIGGVENAGLLPFFLPLFLGGDKIVFHFFSPL